MDFNIMTRLDVCKAKVRIAERTFTTFGSRGGVVFVINGAWQLGDKLLTTDQGACWFDGRHTLRLLQPQGKLLFSEINWLAGHSPRWMQCWHASKNHVLPVGKCKFRAFHRQHFATDSPTFYAYQSIPYSLPARSFHCYRSGNRGWLSATRVIYVSGNQAFFASV
jgi:hypothetical protein